MDTTLAYVGHNSRLPPYHTVSIYKSTITSDIYRHV